MAESSPRLLFHFLHLLGVGHVHRAKRLIEAFSQAGIETDVLYGGMPLDDLDLGASSVHFLPPIRAEDATYKRMLTADGEEVSPSFLTRRTDKILDIAAGLSPDIILTEAFPFGRRIIRHEIDALLRWAKRSDRPPLIVSSVRDILQEKRKPGRVEEARDWVCDRYDRVLVHADPEVIRLDETFPAASDIKDKLAYTGFVVPRVETPAASGEFDIIVSAGGGAFGAELLRTAMDYALSRDQWRWCFATGPNLDEASRTALRGKAPSHITVVDRLDNLAGHLKTARLSLSQCGYNTAMDVLAAHESGGCRAVFVPYDLTGQTEQSRRAQLLEKAGYAISVPQSKLTLARLESAIESALALPKVHRSVDFNGAANSAKLLLEWIGARR